MTYFAVLVYKEAAVLLRASVVKAVHGLTSAFHSATKKIAN